MQNRGGKGEQRLSSLCKSIHTDYTSSVTPRHLLPSLNCPSMTASSSFEYFVAENLLVSAAEHKHIYDPYTYISTCRFILPAMTFGLHSKHRLPVHTPSIDFRFILTASTFVRTPNMTSSSYPEHRLLVHTNRIDFWFRTPAQTSGSHSKHHLWLTPRPKHRLLVHTPSLDIRFTL